MMIEARIRAVEVAKAHTGRIDLTDLQVSREGRPVTISAWVLAMVS